MRLSYSTVAGVTDMHPTRVDSTWRVLVKKLSRVEPRGKYTLKEYLALSTNEKRRAKVGPGWVPAVFKRGGKRTDGDVKELTAFVGDIDNKGDTLTLRDLRRALRGFEAVIHTTFSHTKEQPRFRFVVPYKTPIDPGEHLRVFHYFDRLLGGGVLDPKGKTPSQLYYWPSCPPDSVRAFTSEHLRGKPLRLSALPADAKRVEQNRSTDRRGVGISEDLPRVKIGKLGLSKRIVELIQTGEDPSRKYVSRSEAIFAVAVAMVSRGCTDAEIASVLMNPKYRISEKTLEQKNPLKYVATTIKKARSAKFVGDPKTIEDAIAEMNSKHAVVNVGGACLILTETMDPVLKRRQINLSRERDLRLQYANRRIIVNEKPVTIADLWLQHENRRQYDQIVFSPDKDFPGCFNLWKGFALKPAKGNCSLYLEHIRENIANGSEEIYNYIIGFMADAVQRPGRLPGVAMVMRGEEGVGKGVFATEFGRLFGQHFIQVSHARHLVGNFNAHLKDVLLVFADEAFWAGDKSAQGVLNAIITEQLRVIEHKGKDPITVANFVRLLIASNHDWVVPAGMTARRFFVIDVGNKHLQDRRYFAAIRREMAKGGRAALLRMLLDYDLTGFDPANFPRTEALFDQQVRSMSAEEKFWLDRLRRGELLNYEGKWTRIAKCSTFYDQFVAMSQRSGYTRRAGETEFGLTLKKLCPELRRIRKRSDEDFKKRAYYYEFPPLAECRAAFEEKLKMKINWKA